MNTVIKKNFSRLALSVAVITLAIVIAPFWLVMRDLFDGASVRFAFETGLTDGLYDWLMSANWLLGVIFFKFIFVLANLMAIDYQWLIKIALTILFFLVFYEIYKLGVDLFGHDRNEALLMASTCLASPCLYAFVNSAAIPILLCIWMMFMGHRLFLHRLTILQITGLLFVIASFQLNSNLVMVLALNFVYLYKFRVNWRLGVVRFAFLFGIAILFFVMIKNLAAPENLFVEYNKFLNPLNFDDAKRMFRAAAMYGTWSLIPLVVTFVLGIAAFFLKSRTGSSSHFNLARQREIGFGVVASVFLFTAAAFPYIMVGKGFPLVALIGYGNGLTEQILQANYSGPFAPTWSSTSSRHALLASFMISMLTFCLAQMFVGQSRMARTQQGLLIGVATCLLPLLSFSLPALYNKLEMQYSERSLSKGLALLGPAPAGVVEVHYRPTSDWLIWGNAGTEILREAWGRSHYFTMMHSVNAYKLDLLWGYNAYFKRSGGLGSALVQNSLAMDGFPGEACYSTYEAKLPKVGVLTVAMAGVNPSRVEPATVQLVQSDCQADRKLINPLPEKKFIP